jgi:hypothetical protein
MTMYQQVAVQCTTRVRVNKQDRVAAELDERHPICCYILSVHRRWYICNVIQPVSSVGIEDFFCLEWGV